MLTIGDLQSDAVRHPQCAAAHRDIVVQLVEFSGQRLTACRIVRLASFLVLAVEVLDLLPGFFLVSVKRDLHCIRREDESTEHKLGLDSHILLARLYVLLLNLAIDFVIDRANLLDIHELRQCGQRKSQVKRNSPALTEPLCGERNALTALGARPRACRRDVHGVQSPLYRGSRWRRWDLHPQCRLTGLGLKVRCVCLFRHAALLPNLRELPFTPAEPAKRNSTRAEFSTCGSVYSEEGHGVNGLRGFFCVFFGLALPGVLLATPSHGMALPYHRLAIAPCRLADRRSRRVIRSYDDTT